MLKLIIIFSLFVLSFCQQTENNGTFGDTVNGNDLVKLGRQLQKPMLTIIGMALRNLHACEWTNWSPCSVRKGYFGSRTRTRTCNYDRNVGNTNSTIENDNKLCEGKCPSDYNITKHGYCIKFYTDSVENDDAVTQCRNDGGYLINIESKQKHDDIKAMLQGINEYPYVGGKRKDLSSPWVFEYGIQKGFMEWVTGQPNFKSSEFCLCLDKSTRHLYDVGCTDKRTFLCEIVYDL
ncbi:hypothetical protein ACF0H5_021947 [Mactra antiquata]